MTEQIRGWGQPTWPLSPYQIRVSYGATATANAPAGTIARGTGADWFGPLDPLRPIAPPEVAGRRFDFPSGYNLVTRPRAYEPIGFAELRAFADAYDLLRLVIETRKDQMERQRWRIRARQFVSAPAQRARGSAQSAAEGARSATPGGDTSARIAAVQNFFQKPDGVTRWKTWLRALLEDMFVIDAATLYCQRTRSGRLCALQQLDGATIKRVIDDWGRTPLPYADAGGATIYPPAYQQVLKGLPAVNYSAHDIIYRPRNVRAHRVYGYSPVQQVLMTVNIALRRQLWQLDYFSEGSIPDALIGVPQNWTPDQIKQFQDYWDTEFAGDLARRRRAKFVPGEAAAKVVQTKEPSHKDDFDEWLARIICYAFSVPPQWATKVMNRATADNQSAQAEDEGLEPTKEWVKDLVDEIIAEELSSPDLELAWLDEDEADPKGLEAVLEGRVKLGAVTLNEMRDALGLDPYANAAADRPMVLTATGYVPIEANVDAQGASVGGQVREAKTAARSADDSIVKAAADDPEHPGWPARTSGGKGGQFRPKDEEGGGSAGDYSDRSGDAPGTASPSLMDGASRVASPQGPQYASLETGTQNDATDPRSGGQPDSDVQYAAATGLFWVTGNYLIDKTSATLLLLLTQVVDRVGPLGALSPSQYGTKIHTAFAAAVKAEGLPGVEVEQSFGGSYGAKGSVRTDVILRDASGAIIAIYDVKTGDAQLEPWRVRQLRAKTGTTLGTYVFEIHPDRGVLLKYRSGFLKARPASEYQ